MDLERKHLVENNKLCMQIGIGIELFIILATYLYTEGRYFSSTVMYVLEVISLVVAIVGYVFLKDHENGHYPILLSLAVSYMAILLGSVHTPYLWAFGILIGMAVIIYNDAKICVLAVAVCLIENIIFMVMYYSSPAAAEATSRFMVPTNFAFVVCFGIIAGLVVKVNDRQIEETMEDIERRSEEQAVVSKRVQKTSEEIASKLEVANEAMSSLSKKVNSSANAVGEISSSITMTAEAIQTQTEMNSNISTSLDSIADESKTAMAQSDAVKSNIHQGNEIIVELQKQSEASAMINEQTAEMTNELAKSVETVKEIVATILGISSQTNLLALNASIEAARAGEAGKGFAVVADEIRQLSENTRESAEMITSTIDSLLGSVSSATSNMSKSVESSNKQGELIKEAGEKFSEIFTSVEVLSQNVEEISRNVEACVQATNVVMDAISDLSATSQEVAASSETALHLSTDCTSDMSATNSILDEILELSRN